MEENRAIRVIISGGGTGGHIFPALSIAAALKEMNPANEILFVGAEGRMEMEKVPAAGYEIIGLPVSGLKRSLSFGNFRVLLNLCKSLKMAKKILRDFKADLAIGVGGYASVPVLMAAQQAGIPTLIQEQNGFAGLGNKILGRRAKCICVAYEGMEKFFPADRIVLSGNPIRREMRPLPPAIKKEAADYYGLSHEKKHLLIVGGSLGSRTLNKAVMKWIESGCPGGDNMDILWQCGKTYKTEVDEFMAQARKKGLGRGVADGVHHSDFIMRMDLAYALADVVVSRSGASSISELCAVHKAAIFVPSPNVTEDHQTHNAMALVNKGAGMIVRDSEAVDKLMETACSLLADEEKIKSLETNIAALAKTDAAMTIAREAYNLLK